MITEYVTGVGMTGFSKGEKKVVTEELLRYVDMLHRIKSKTTGNPDPEAEGPVIPPYRVMAADDRKDTWPRKTSDKEEYVFCHNDLSQANAIVDAKTFHDQSDRGLGVRGVLARMVRDAHLEESWAECGPGEVWGEG